MNIHEQIQALNEMQQRAALCSRHCNIIAGPGSGKTKTMAVKAAYLLSNPENRVCAVTFSRDAALELRSRIDKMIHPDWRARIIVGTYHSIQKMQISPGEAKRSVFGSEIMRAQKSQIDWREKLLDNGHRILFGYRLAEKFGYDPDECLRLVEAAKEASVNKKSHPAQNIADAYQSMLSAEGMADFQDILIRCVKGLEDKKVSPLSVTHLLCDEYQDTDSIQYLWIAEHARSGAITTTVGDDDQSIYAFRRGMGYEGMQRFMQAFSVETIVLNINYRSHHEIIAAADRVIRFNTARIEKKFLSQKGAGGGVFAYQVDGPETEAFAIVNMAKECLASAKSMGILARINRHLDQIESSLLLAGVPYRRVGEKSILERPEAAIYMTMMLAMDTGKMAGIGNLLSWLGVGEKSIKVLIDYLKEFKYLSAKSMSAILKFRMEDEAEHKIYRGLFKTFEQGLILAQEDKKLALITRYLIDATENEKMAKVFGIVEKLFAKIPGRLSDRISLVKRQSDELSKKPDGVELMSMHGSKGLEWDTVWMAYCDDETTPDPDSGIEEERRIFYVGMTRAIQRLVISSARNTPSRFTIDAGIPIARLAREA